MISKERVKELEEKGFQRWQKGSFIRLYMKYNGYEIEDYKGIGFTVFYQGDEIFFRTEDEAREFIDQEG